MLPSRALIGRNSKMEPVEVQSVDLGAGSEGTQEVVGAATSEATLQKSGSVEEGQEEEEPETSK